MIIDGKEIAARRLEDLRSKIKGQRSKIKLVAMVVGDNPASEMYVWMKSTRAGEVGVESEVKKFSEGALIVRLIRELRSLSEDKSVTGILVQLPLPQTLQKHTQEILDAINPAKDVDCLTSENLELLRKGKPKFLPATVRAIIIALLHCCIVNRNDLVEINNETIEQLNNWLVGRIVTVIGQGKLVGKPLTDYLEGLGVKVNRCDEYTDSVSLRKWSKEADILVAATGVAGLITADMVKRGAIVIDCGAPKAEVDQAAAEIASAITPVPGGVGPLTVVSLLENTVEAAYNLLITHT